MGFSGFEATEVVLEPGAYRARLKSIEEGERSNYNTGEPEKCLRWTFEILEEGDEGVEIKQNTSMSFAPSSNARKWTTALLGRKIEPGEKVAPGDVLDREADLGVELNETDRGTFTNITSVNPVRKKKSRAQDKAESKQVKDVRDGRAPVDDSENDEDFDSIPF